MVCSGNNPQYPLDRVPGASIPEACGPLHLQYHAKTAAAFPAGRQHLGFQVFPGASARASSKEAALMARTKSWSG